MNTRSIVSAFAVAGLLVASAHTVSIAANGGNALIGKTNSGSKTTTFKTTGNGAALSLKSKSSKPALKISNSKKIKKLNADKLDGFDSAALLNKPMVFTAPALGAADSSLDYPLPLGAGKYLIDWQILLTLSASDALIDCYIFQNNGAVAIGPEDRYFAGSTFSTASTFVAVNGTGYIDNSAGSPLAFRCATTGANVTATTGSGTQPTQVIVTKVDGLSGSGTLTNAPKPGPPAR